MSQNINTFDENLAIHQQMDDEPNDVGGLSAEELKAKFDYAAQALQKFLNEQVIPAHNRLGADLDRLEEALSNHVDVDPGNITAQNVGLLRELADRFGLTDMLVPTVYDALEVLEPLVAPRDQLVKLAPAHIYMEHWWQRRKAAHTFAPSVGNVVTVDGRSDVTRENCIVYGGSNSSVDQTITIYYADAVAHNTAGQVVLVSPKSLVITRPAGATGSNFSTGCEALRGKYIKNSDGYIRYIQDDTVFREQSPGSYVWSCWATKSCSVEANVPARKWETLRSENRNAYPDRVSGEWEYQYVGVPVDEVVQTWLRDKCPDEEGAE